MRDDIIYSKRPFVLINDSGYYFDKFNEGLAEPVIKYPSYEELLKIEIKDQIFILNPTQEKELKYLTSYIPAFKSPVYMNQIIGLFIQGEHNYKEEEVLSKINDDFRYRWLTLFVYGRLFRKHKLNPSYLLITKPVVRIWYAYNLSKIELPKTRRYLDFDIDFNHIFFLELALADLKGETEESKAIEELISKGKLEKDKIPAKLYETLMREGIVYLYQGKVVVI